MFDKWTANTDNRQVLCLPQRQEFGRKYHMFMIDNGFCFAGSDWVFRDAVYRGLLLDTGLYSRVEKCQFLDAWLARLEEKVTMEELDKIICGIPPIWIKEDRDQLRELMKSLYERKKHVATLIELSWKAICSRNSAGLSRVSVQPNSMKFAKSIG